MKKVFLLTLLTSIISISTLGVEYDEMSNFIKPPAYRVGTSDDIEVEYKIKNSLTTKTAKIQKEEFDIRNMTYADLSIKRISNEISKNLEMEQTDILSDLSVLWQGAATKSDTIKFALYKLSNPDADKPDEKSVKKVLTTIAGMSTILGAGAGNPMLATGAFLGGSMLGVLSEDTKTLNYKYTKVNDADMIILVRKIDELQQTLVDSYFDYITARNIYYKSIKMTKERYNNYKLSQNGSKELIMITDAYYKESLDIQIQSENNFYSKRASLEQLVGKVVFKQFESGLNTRENTDKK